MEKRIKRKKKKIRKKKIKKRKRKKIKILQKKQEEGKRNILLIFQDLISMGLFLKMLLNNLVKNQLVVVQLPKKIMEMIL